MAGIGDALKENSQLRTRLLQRPLELADRPGSRAARDAADQEMGRLAGRLRAQLEEYRDGWTAPVPKPWKDRQPLAYAILLLAAGAAIGQIVPPLARWAFKLMG
jgi:hypothetical protein